MLIFILICHLVIIACLILPFGLTLFAPRPPAHSAAPPNATDHTLSHDTEQHHFACIITAYNRCEIAFPLIQSLLRQTHSNFHIYLVADQCGDANLLQTYQHETRLHCLLPPEALRSKVKSMQYAMQHLAQTPTHIVVFDPDNLAIPDFLAQLDHYLQGGYEAVQGRRIAKNLDTPYACADALGEIYKNYIERYAPFCLGSSASIAGSGMAVSTPLFEAFLQSPPIARRQAAQQVIAAEDKLLQHFLVAQNQRIAFAHAAWLYDEKIQTGEQVTRQRTRWLFAYFDNIAVALRHIGGGLLRLQWNRFLFGCLSIIPPLFILLLVAGLFAMADTLIATLSRTNWQAVLSGIAPLQVAFWWQAAAALWLSIGIFAANIVWTLYLDRAPRPVWQALWQMPAFVGRQILSLVQINKARRDFLSTQHTQLISLEEAQQQQQQKR